MLSIFFATLSGLILFVMGYYFGHQIGSTRHIREQLAKVRPTKRHWITTKSLCYYTFEEINSGKFWVATIGTIIHSNKITKNRIKFDIPIYLQ